MDAPGGEANGRTVGVGDDGSQGESERRRQWWIIALVGLLALLLGGGGALLLTSGGSDSKSTGGTSKLAASTSTTHGSATTTVPATPGLTHIVWVTGTASGPVVRVGDLSGAAFRTVATLPMSAQVMAVGSGRLMYWTAAASSRLHGLDLATGADTDYGGGGGYSFFGGAFSPDGTQFAYVRATDVTEASLRVLTFSTGAVTALRSFPGAPPAAYDAPKIWLTSAMTSVDVIGFSDAGSVGVARLNPTTGVRTAHTDLSGHGSTVLSADGTHGANAFHASLGDEGDVPGALNPGPQNTLRTFSVGSAPTNAFSTAHHAIVPLAYNRDGSRLLFADTPAAGGFAGVSISPDFGLLEWNGTAKSQITTYGSTWDAAAFVDLTSFVAAKHDPVSGGAVATLMRWNGSALTAIDTIGSGVIGVYAY